MKTGAAPAAREKEPMNRETLTRAALLLSGTAAAGAHTLMLAGWQPSHDTLAGMVWGALTGAGAILAGLDYLTRTAPARARYRRTRQAASRAAHPTARTAA